MFSRRRRVLTNPDREEGAFLGELVRSETTGGAVALMAAAIALLWANLAGSSYVAFRHWGLGPHDLEQWAADGGLTLFFLVAGLEVKREFVTGSLRRPADAAVPVVAAACGVILPAVLFVCINASTDNLRGWAIPSATDVAFALAVLALAGSALPAGLRAFLLTLAVVDDLIVIAVIALFYSTAISWTWLAGAAVLLIVHALLQRRRDLPVTTGLWLTLPVALAAWWCMYHSGVHATVAGVAIGLLTRVRRRPGEQQAPAERLIHHLTPWSATLAVPLFALLSAGVAVRAGGSLLSDPVVWGVATGLVLGKPLGVLGGTWLVTRLSRAELATGVVWRDLIGVGILSGIGFTVSLLVADLSYDDSRQDAAKVAVLAASLVSAVAAAGVLRSRNHVHTRLPRRTDR
jgi:NhaA family Na+:H+ antiporter